MMDIACTIAERVGELEQTDPLALPPLGEAIDVSALERAIESVEGPFSIQFSYCGHIVTVMGEDEVSICAAVEDDHADHRRCPGEQTRT